MHAACEVRHYGGGFADADVRGDQRLAEREPSDRFRRVTTRTTGSVDAIHNRSSCCARTDPTACAVPAAHRLRQGYGESADLSAVASAQAEALRAKADRPAADLRRLILHDDGAESSQESLL